MLASLLYGHESPLVLTRLLCAAVLPPCLRPLQDNMVIDDFKYSVKVIRRAPFIFNVQLNKSNVDVVARKLGDGGFLLQVRKREQRFCRKAAATIAVIMLHPHRSVKAASEACLSCFASADSPNTHSSTHWNL